MDDQVFGWLMQGDPAIRWQVMRDLLDQPKDLYEQERAKVAEIGWGNNLLEHQNDDGNWSKGVYSPKWTSTTYTLLLLRQFGLPTNNPQATRGCERFFFRGLEKDGGINLFASINYSETCINGMILSLLSYFKHPDERIHSIAGYLLNEQMQDGGWNCRRRLGDTHSSFHTTISVLEGLGDYIETFPARVNSITAARDRAHQFLFKHKLYQSHRTGKPADPAMTRMAFPTRWRYDFLRGLDYLQSIQVTPNEDMLPAIQLLLHKRDRGGTWTLNKPMSGKVYFDMEETGQPSRWNTLRALRVLKWWNTH